MHIQPPDNNKGPAYPSIAGIAAMAAACMLGSMSHAYAAGTPPSPAVVDESSPGSSLEHLWQDEALYARQRAAEDALLGAYADRNEPLPAAVLQQVQDLVRQYARERAGIWQGKIHGEALVPSNPKSLGRIAVEPESRRRQIIEEFYLIQGQHMRSYDVLGRYAYTDEDMPKEKLAQVAAAMLSHVRERKALPLKHAVVLDPVSINKQPVVKGLIVQESRTASPEQPDCVEVRRIRAAHVEPLSDQQMTQQLQNAYDEARSSLYLQQQAEEQALLGAYVGNGAPPVPDGTMQQLRELVLKYAAQREELRNRYVELGEKKDALLQRQKQEADELRKMQEHEIYGEYGKIGAPVYLGLDGTAVTDESLQGVKELVFRQIRQRAEMQKEHQEEQMEMLRSLHPSTDVRLYRF